MSAHRELKWTFQVDCIETMISPVDLSFMFLLSWRKGVILVTYFFLPLCIKMYASTTCPENAYAGVIWRSLRFLWANTVSSLAVECLGNWVELLKNSCACHGWKGGRVAGLWPSRGVLNWSWRQKYKWLLAAEELLRWCVEPWLFFSLSLQGITRRTILLRDSVCC